MEASKVIPILRIFDEIKAREFYIGWLGFTVDWDHRFQPNFPVFMQVSRDGMALFLTEHRGDCPVGGLVHFYVPDVDAWYAEFQRKEIPVQEPPNQSIDGLRDMNVLDPDGNKLRFCTRLEG